MSPRPPDEQPELLPGLVRATLKQSQAKARETRARKAAEAAVSEVDPVARVLVDVALAHLDRPFDYAVPASMADDAVPGARVKVRFAGQDVDGYLLERVSATDHTGRLAPLRRVVSPEPVLTPAVAGLARDLAERYAGVRSDVLRLAVPPRHATTEKQPSPPAPDVLPIPPPAGWSGYGVGEAFLSHLADGGNPRAVWSVTPGDDWAALVAEAAVTTLRSGRGALVCVPDRKDVARVDAALTAAIGAGHHVTLTADSGPAARYRDFLAVLRGTRRIVVGTRAAAFAPVRDLGLVVVWDDGDDLHAEPRAPYPHTREVLLLRCEREGTAALVGAFSRSVEAAHLVRSGWAHDLSAPRQRVRAAVTVVVAGASDHDRLRDPAGIGARMPTQVHDVLKRGLVDGPVLVQTPRAGYALALACERCRTPARCATCAGPLALTSPTTPPACRWCATAAVGWACRECGAAGLRAPVIGEARTAEELGRSFPRTRVRQSAGEHVLTDVPDVPAIVVATPGAEPVAAGGYTAVVLLDPWLLLGRDDLRADEEALRRWSNAVGLVRPGGRAIVVGDPTHPAVQALVRWDQPGFALREADERREARLPPTTRLATVTGEPGAVDDALTLLAPPPHVEVLGPVPAGPDEERLVLRTPRARGADLSHALGELQRIRSSRKLDAVRVQVDPTTL
ncbi:primosomal protein N' [Nocardioides rubriscoriae]|uniref:primosomal protein N' n=1 Tax=Nocardioides rubriscoriae TaxID=642762 RepID=UPI0011E03D6F|nr:primosomal protein N' [Nocardioides rubriscoriae]